MPNPIRAVLFDLWGTLILDDATSAEARSDLRIEQTGATLAALGFPYDRADIVAAFLAAGTELAAIHEAERDLSAHGRTVMYLQHLDDRLGEKLDDAAWKQLDAAVLTPALSHPPAIMLGAADALAAVRALGLPMGLISNAGITPGFVLRQFLDDFGLLKYFDVTVFSDEAEMSKPSSAIFAHALTELDVAAEEAAFIGDQPVLDVFGSRRAGIWTVQLGDVAADGIEPHARIDTLAELVPALVSLGLVSPDRIDASVSARKAT